MSTEVTRPNGGIVVPARFQNRGRTESLGEGISSGFPILRIRGGKWRLSTGKDEEHLVPPVKVKLSNGEWETRAQIDAVILRAPPFNSRTYYKGYKGAGSKGERPLCSSLRGVKPDGGVPEPQSKLCDHTCPRNQTYTNDRGMKVRDCSNGKRLAILPWMNWTTPLLGKPLVRPTLLRVPGASLAALKKYGEDLDRMGVPYYALLTTIHFDESKEFPQMIFNYNTAIPLDDESAEIIDAMRETPDARTITGEDARSSEREIDHEEPEADKVIIQKPVPAAVSLAQALKAAKEEKVIEGEVLAPKVKVTHNGKPQERAVTTMAEVVAEQVAADADADAEEDEAFKAEVMKLVG